MCVLHVHCLIKKQRVQECPPQHAHSACSPGVNVAARARVCVLPLAGALTLPKLPPLLSAAWLLPIHSATFPADRPHRAAFLPWLPQLLLPARLGPLGPSCSWPRVLAHRAAPPPATGGRQAARSRSVPVTSCRRASSVSCAGQSPFLCRSAPQLMLTVWGNGMDKAAAVRLGLCEHRFPTQPERGRAMAGSSCVRNHPSGLPWLSCVRRDLLLS